LAVNGLLLAVCFRAPVATFANFSFLAGRSARVALHHTNKEQFQKGCAKTHHWAYCLAGNPYLRSLKNKFLA